MLPEQLLELVAVGQEMDRRTGLKFDGDSRFKWDDMIRAAYPGRAFAVEERSAGELLVEMQEAVERVGALFDDGEAAEVAGKAEFDPHLEPLAITNGAGKIRVRVHQLVRSLRGDVFSGSEVLQVFTANSGLIAAIGFDDEPNLTAAPSAAFARRS